MSGLRQTALTCSGHTRPVVDLAFSSITPSGFFLISACKGNFPHPLINAVWLLFSKFLFIVSYLNVFQYVYINFAVPVFLSFYLCTFRDTFSVKQTIKIIFTGTLYVLIWALGPIVCGSSLYIGRPNASGIAVKTI